MVRSKAVLSLFVMILATGAAAASDIPAALDVYPSPAIAAGQEFEVTSYYPAGIGCYWKYQDTAENNVQFKLAVKKTVLANGKQCSFFERDTRLETDSITNAADGIFLHAQERTNADGSILRSSNTPPVKFSDAKTKVGNVCETTPSFQNPGTGNTLTWRSTMAGVQDVTVGTNKFTNCPTIKVLVTDTKLGVKLCEFQMWIAKGVGVVKRQGNFFGRYFVQNLLEWHVQ